MARVFGRPRYIHQARNKLISLAVAADDFPTTKAVVEALGVHPDAIPASQIDYHMYAELAMSGTEVDEIMPGIAQQLESYLLDAEIGRMCQSRRLTEPSAALKLTKDFLATYKHHAPSAIFSDEEAVFQLLRFAMADAPVARESTDSRSARKAARTLITMQLAGQKISPAKWESAAGQSRFGRGLDPRAAQYDTWITAAENLQYKSQPMWVKYGRLWAMELPRMKPHVREMVEKVGLAEPQDRHKFTGIEVAVSHGESSSYNYAGIVVTYLNGCMYVLDTSASDYLRTAFTSLRNSQIAFNDYRITGDTEPVDLSAPFRRCIMWLTSALSDPARSREVARHMHLAYTRWQNIVCEESAMVNCGHEARDADLRADMVKFHPKNSGWYDLVSSMQVPERAKAELFKLYHLLPPPDIDPLMLHNEIAAKTSKTNTYNTTEIAAFIEFCAAYDFARFVYKNRKLPKHVTRDAYGFRDEGWYKACMAGRMTLPPKADWGRVRINGEFPYDHTGDFHIFDAKDATRVVADLDKYMSREQSRDLGDADTNELLSALFNGSKLSNGESMQEWRARVDSGALTAADVVIAAEAGKAENTKPGKKVRETLSACDTVREYLSEVDKSLRPLASQTPGVSIRVDYVRHKRKFQTMAGHLSRYATRLAFGTSTDIDGWSPNMPRHMFHAWQDYALSTTECKDPRAVRKLWDRLTLFVDRRGTKAQASCPEGNIQGWPATSDTTMHAHILIYWAYRLRDEGILSKDEAAFTQCLIDDAATVVAVDGTPEQARQKATRAKDLLSEIYKLLGFTMSETKSFFSSIKFVYLNELYVDGAQVMHATKTTMRIDRDHARRFAALSDQVGATMGVAASAAAQGADPFMAYWLGAYSCFRLAYSVCPDLMNLPAVSQALIAITPAGMNGLGIRPITALYATGAQDVLSWFLEIADSLHGAGYDAELSAIISQEPSEPSAVAVFKNPFGYTVANHTSVVSLVKKAFREAARARKMAEPFASLDRLEHDPAYEALIEEVMTSGEYEAALLEEVATAMPDAFVDEVMNRVDKSELIAALLGSRVIGTLRRRVSAADKMNLGTIVHLLRHVTTRDCRAMSQLHSAGSFAYAKSLRSAMHGKYKVLNHTYPCPYALWTISGEVVAGSDQAERMTTASFSMDRILTTLGSHNKNMYDSRMDKIGYRGYRSVPSNISQEAKVALYNPVKRKLAQGLAAIRWAADYGCHYEPVRDLFLHAWAGDADYRLMSLSGRQFEGSAKRLSLRHNKSNHLVMIYPNTQGAAKVDTRAVTRAHGARHHMHDMMAAITSLRTATLLEASLQIMAGNRAFCYGYLYRPAAAGLVDVARTACRRVSSRSFEAIRAFVDIDSDLAASARAACSFEVMHEVQAKYLAAGAKAAAKLFNSYVEDGNANPDDVHVMEGTEVQVTAEVMAARREATRSTVVLTDLRRYARYSGTVATEDPVRTRHATASTTVAALSEPDALEVIGQGLLDTTAVTLANHVPDAAADLWAAGKQGAWQEWVEAEDAAEGKALNPGLIVPNDPSIRALVTSVKNTAVTLGLGEGMARTLFAAGMPGFRMAEDNPDPQHTVKSFLWHAESVIGLARGVYRSLKKLKGASSKDYSTTSVAGGKTAAAATCDVLRAQWRFAAARRDHRNKELMAADGSSSTDAVTRRNYEAVFLRAAARELKSTGRLAPTALHSACIDGATSSLAKHITKEDDRDAFIEEIAATELDDTEGYEDLADVASHIRAVCRVASQWSTDISSTPITDALSAVSGWVAEDVGGLHASVRLRSARTVLSEHRPIAQGWEEIPPPAADDAEAKFNSQVLEIPSVTVGGVTANSAWADLPAGDMYQWLVDTPEAWQVYSDAHGAPDAFDDYYEISSSRTTYEAWVINLQSLLPGYSPEAPLVTVFDPPNWAYTEGEGDAIHE